MDLAEGIRKLGFRRWYERQLIESHVYFVTAFLSMILVAACIEEIDVRAPGWTPVLLFALIVGGTVLCIWSLGRYKFMLDRAEYAAERSVCANCTAYGRLELLPAPAEYREPAARAAPPLKVRCRKCGHEWNID